MQYIQRTIGDDMRTDEQRLLPQAHSEHGQTVSAAAAAAKSVQLTVYCCRLLLLTQNQIIVDTCHALALRFKGLFCLEDGGYIRIHQDTSGTFGIFT